MRAIGIAIPFFRRRSGVPIDAQAQVHFNRVIADGGVVPSGLSGVNAFFSAVKAIYGTSDINTAISAAYDAHYLGYKLGAGSGTTLGQAAQKLYSVKSTENLLLQSENFASASWNKNNISVTINDIIAPNGTLTGSKIVANSISNNFLSQTLPTLTNGQVYTVSRYVKAGNINFCTIGLHMLADAYFDLVNLTYRFSGPGAVSASITDVGDGWRRISASYTWTGSTYVAYFAFASSLFSQAGITIGAFQYTWGAQLNTESVALPYTPTTTTTQTLADVTQTTAASQPLLLAHTGTNYYFNSNAVGNNVTTPLKISNGYNGEFEIQAWIEPTIFASGTVQDYPVIFTAGSNFSLGITLNGTSSTLRSLSCPRNGGGGGVTTNTIDVSTFKGWIKLYRTATNLRWETSTDGVNWTFFENVTIANTAFTLTGNSVIGNYNNSDTRAQYSGRINRVLVWINGSSSTGTLTYDFNPASYNPSVSQTQWTSATGEIWSVSTGTANGYKGLLVDKTVIQGDGIDDVLISTGLASRQYYSSYVASRIQTNSGVVRGIFGSLGQRNLIYVNTTGDVRAIAVGIVQFAGEVNDRYQLFTANFELSAGSVLTNNANKVSGALGGVVNTSAYILSDGSTGFGNNVFSTGLQSVTTDSVAINTAIYNYIRSINGNSF